MLKARIQQFIQEFQKKPDRNLQEVYVMLNAYLSYVSNDKTTLKEWRNLYFSLQQKCNSFSDEVNKLLQDTYMNVAQILLDKLNAIAKEASDKYYNDGESSISDKQYDEIVDFITQIESDTGLLSSSSITQNVGAEVRAVSSLKKVKHEEKALSLGKTKSRTELLSWLGNKEGVLSWKLDGLTGVATYDNGVLTSLVTRGNGEVGEDVTHNAVFFKGLPQTIPYKQHLVVRGECLMTFSDFNRVNNSMPDTEARYKNPRNLASGTVRALDNKVVKDRGIHFVLFQGVTSITNIKFSDDLEKLRSFGFTIVPYVLVNSQNLLAEIENFEKKIDKLAFPTDGLVLQLNDLQYAKTLGTTAKFPKCAIAFKWKDETATTTIRQIVWQPSRTGLINPVAVFDPVELEGTTVSRATCNNISFMMKHNLCVGSNINVYKANMIIPTIDCNNNPSYGDYRTTIPKVCPCCGMPTKILQTKETYVLTCPNPYCSAKNLKNITHFVSRDAMNIMGLAESTLDLLISNGFIQSSLDLYMLKQKPEIMQLEGFGKTAYTNLIESIEKSRNTTLDRYLYAWGIDQIGRKTAKDISKICKGDPKVFINAMDSNYDWSNISGFGGVMDNALKTWWKFNRELFVNGCMLLQFNVQTQQAASSAASGNNGIADKTFCVTGAVNIFKNRKELEEYIENHGGKLTGSVTSKTDYLITNDTTSGSSKNQKAKELGKPILTEEQLIQLGGGM